MAPFRRHSYDFENVQLKDKITLDGDKKALLYFVAYCKYCGKEIITTRETFIAKKNNTFIPSRFCIRDPKVFAKWRESRVERREYLSELPLPENILFNEDQEALTPSFKDKPRTGL